MSWSERTWALLVRGLLAAALAGCGFTPLYQQRTETQTVAQLAAIELAPPDDRLAQLVRNHLIGTMPVAGGVATPLYRLHIVATEAQGGVLITRGDTVTRYNLVFNASYNLQDIRSGTSLIAGVASSTVAYSVLRAEFASLIAERDARSRAARDVGEQIRSRLAVYFSRPAGERNQGGTGEPPP